MKGWEAKCPLCNYTTKSFEPDYVMMADKSLSIVHKRIEKHLWLMHDDVIVEAFANASCEFNKIKRLGKKLPIGIEIPRHSRNRKD